MKKEGLRQGGWGTERLGLDWGLVRGLLPFAEIRVAETCWRDDPAF